MQFGSATYTSYANYASQSGETDGLLVSDYSTVVNNAPTDLTLVADTSPALNAGVTIGSVTADINGISRPQGAAFDIGAYEYFSSPGSPLLCWQLTGRYNTGRLFQLNGSGSYPKEFIIPGNVNRDTLQLIDEGLPIDKNNYKII